VVLPLWVEDAEAADAAAAAATAKSMVE